MNKTRLSNDQNNNLRLFNQILTVEGGPENVFLESSSSFSTYVRENLALVTSFSLKSNTDVLPGSKKTDTFTAISLEYTF